MDDQRDEIFSRVTKRKKDKKNYHILLDGLIPSILEPDRLSKDYRRNWASLIKKKKILKHLDLWHLKARPPPRANAPPPNVRIDYSDSQVPPCEDYLYTDPNYFIVAYAS